MSETSALSRRLVRVLRLAAVGASIRLVLRCRLVTIAGGSMMPALGPGDRVLVVPLPCLGPGDIVAVPDPRDPDRLLVKRVAELDSARGAVWLVGDNAGASTDSRTFGPVRRSAIVGRVIYRYAPPSRVGHLLGSGGQPGTSSGRPQRGAVRSC